MTFVEEKNVPKCRRWIELRTLTKKVIECATKKVIDQAVWSLLQRGKEAENNTQRKILSETFFVNNLSNDLVHF